MQLTRPWTRHGVGMALFGALWLTLATPDDVSAKPKPLPLPGGGSSSGGGGGGGEGDEKCGHCNDEFAEKAAKCMDDYDKCQAPCPACATRANCEARKPCMAPCNVKFSKCKDDADKERKECKKAC